MQYLDNITQQKSQPFATRIAVILVVFSNCIGVFYIAVKKYPLLLRTYFFLIVLLGVLLFFTWLIHRGKNWARWLFLVLFGMGIFLLPQTIARLQARSKSDLIFYLIQTLLQLAAAVLLLLRPSRQWFQRRDLAS